MYTARLKLFFKNFLQILARGHLLFHWLASYRNQRVVEARKCQLEAIMVGKKTFIMCHLFFVMFCLTNQPWEALMAFAAPFMLRLALRND